MFGLGSKLARQAGALAFTGLACGAAGYHASSATSVSAASRGKGTKVGEFSSSGLVFKDTVEVTAIPDPKVPGVTIYVSNVLRPLSDRMMKSFFSDPSAIVVSAVKTGPVPDVTDAVKKSGIAGEDVFSASKSAFFKSVHVKRIYDEDRRVIVYVAYNYSTVTGNNASTGTKDSRYKTSLSCITLD